MLDHDTDSYYKIAGAFVDGQAVGQPHPRQHPRQHHGVLADGHGRLGGPVVLGGRTGSQRPARLRRRSRSRSASPPSPARSGAPRAAGPRRPTRRSPTSTRSTRAATSPPGRSRSCSRPRCGPRSGRCANEEAIDELTYDRLKAPAPSPGARTCRTVRGHVHAAASSTPATLRLHAVIGGDGPPLLLIHGWPADSGTAWRFLMPALAEELRGRRARPARHRAVATSPRSGYDTATLASDLVALMDAARPRAVRRRTAPTPAC